MEEKTADALATSDEHEPIPSLESEDNSAGNTTVDPEPEELLPADAEAVQPTEPIESTEEESNVAADASVISTDTNTELIESNFNSEDGSSAEVTLSEANTEILPVVSEEVNNTSVDEKMEETNSNSMNLCDKMDIESTEINNGISNEEIKSEEKVEPTPHIDTNNAVYQLEEELKRLHGDTSDENKIDNFMGDLSVTSILEDKLDNTNRKDTGDNITTNTNSLLTVKKLEEQPIMKDSDLEEMLSADDVIRDPILIKGKFICELL